MTQNNSENPLISIIVPIYNVEPYLRKCLDSICNQSYSNLEIILVVSTSTDNSGEIAEEYQKTDPRIKIIYRQPLGLSDARNVGIEHSSAPYLVFIDSDDFIAPCFVERLYEMLIEYDCDISQVGYLKIAETQNTIPQSIKRNLNDVTVYTNVEMCLNMSSSGPYKVVSWNKMYKRFLFSDIRFPVGKLHEDVATTYKLYYTASRIAVSNEPLYFYRQVPTSIMGSPFSLKRLDAIEHTRNMVQYFKELGDGKIYGEALYSHLITMYTTRLRVKKYLSNSEKIQKGLYDEMKTISIELRGQKSVSVIKKIISILLIYFPYTMHGLILLRRKILGVV